MPAEPEIVYRVFRCDNGHQWDAFGTMNDEGDFVADDLQVYLCPTCDSVMVEDAEPENLT